MGIFSFLFGERRTEPVSALANTGVYGFEVVGEASYQKALEAICGGRCEEGADHECTATLVPEANNPHDRNAVRVDVEGQTVGYLSRETASNYRASLKRCGTGLQPMTCDALIVGGWERRGKRGHFGIKLDLEWPLRVR